MHIPMTHERARNYLSIKEPLDAELDDNLESFQETLLNYTSIHVVDDNAPVLSCDCKQYHHTGYICSHILVVAHFKNVICLVQKIRPIAKSSSKGRKRQRGSALQRDDSKELLREPNKVLGKSIFFEEYGVGTINQYLSPMKKWVAYFMNVTDVTKICQLSCSRCSIGRAHILLNEDEIVQGLDRINNETYVI